GIDEKEGALQKTKLVIGEVKLRLDFGTHRRQDVAVKVIKEVDADHYGEDVARIAACHRRALCGADPSRRISGPRAAALSGAKRRRRMLPARAHERTLLSASAPRTAGRRIGAIRFPCNCGRRRDG